MIRTQIYLPLSQLQLLKQTAQQENISMSQAARKLIAAGAKQKTPSKKKLTAGGWLLSLAQEAEKMGIKGPKDLASQVDHYLYGASKKKLLTFDAEDFAPLQKQYHFSLLK